MVLTANGHEVQTDAAHVGELVDSAGLLGRPDLLRRRFEEAGYVFVRGLIEPDLVLAARVEMLMKYAVIGEIDDRHPLTEAFVGDRHGLLTTNMRAFTESVRTGARYEAVILHPALLDLAGVLLDAEAIPFDFRWPRLVRPGEGCGFHCDGPYMNRGTDRHLSAWIPLGPVPLAHGGLTLLEGSHLNVDLLNGYLTMDADRDDLVWLEDDPTAVQRRYGGRWLIADYEPGDVLIFSMNMLHGALDNRSADRCRLSSDARYYAAGETPDPRWNGDNLEPHGPGRVFYPGLGRWGNADFQDEWKYVDDRGRLLLDPGVPG